MHRTQFLIFSHLMIGVMLGAIPIQADDNVPNAASAPAPDNSRMNAEDRQASNVTADQAKNNKSDVDIMSQIRRAVVEDKALSTYAHNIKIIAQKGHVTLKGTVHTETEKTNIGQKAADVVGMDQVTNQIVVKGS